jgi:hypothetical protein
MNIQNITPSRNFISHAARSGQARPTHSRMALLLVTRFAEAIVGL